MAALVWYSNGKIVSDCESLVFKPWPDQSESQKISGFGSICYLNIRQQMSSAQMNPDIRGPVFGSLHYLWNLYTFQVLNCIMEIKENKPEDYLPSFKCILRGDSPWATVDKCITNNKMDSGAVKACAKKVG